jgi:hypothetical protein
MIMESEIERGCHVRHATKVIMRPSQRKFVAAACVLLAVSSPVLGQEIQGFLYSSGNYTLLPYGTAANGINKVGQIVGFYDSAAINPTGSSGFIYQNGAFTNILSYPSAAGTDATGISASGLVVGTHSGNQGGDFRYSGGNYFPFSDLQPKWH